MLGKTITGVVKDIVRFTKPVGGILISFNGTVNGLNGATTGLSNEEIGISLESGQNQIKLIQPKLNLVQLAVMATVGEGFILTEGNHATPDANTRTHVFIPIASATLQFDDSAELVVSLDGLKSASNYEVFGVELPGITREYYQYSHVKMLAGRKTEQVNLTAADMYSISSLAAVKKLDLTKVSSMPDGSVAASTHKFEANEIKFLVSQTNDLVFGGSVNSGPNFKSLVLPAHLVHEAELETDGTELDIIIRKPSLL